MAIDLTLKSVAIANREAVPAVINNPGDGGAGMVRAVLGVLASMPASLSITSIIRYVEVPSNARILRIRVKSAAQAAGKFDCGVYRNNADGGAVVDVDLFGSALDFGTAFDNQIAESESTNLTDAKKVQPLWEAGGLGDDPGGTLDIALTVVTEAVTTGLVSSYIEVEYVH